MDAAEVLMKAVKAVEDAGVPEDLRQTAFEKAIQMLSGTMPAAAPLAGGETPLHRSADDGDRIGRLAATLGLPRVEIEEVFLDGGDKGVEIIIGPGKLDSSTAGATKELALLVAGARQHTGIEDWTEASVIRDVCEEFGKFDTNNFARTVAGMDDVFSIRGKGQKRQVKLNRVGTDRLKDLIESLTNAA